MSFRLVDRLTPEDEYEHRPDGDNWQENFVFYGHDHSLSTGISLHLQRVPTKNIVDIRVGVVIDGEFTTLVSELEVDSAFDVPGLTVEFDEPFRRARVRYEGRGSVGFDDDGWLFTKDDGEAPFGFDVTYVSRHEPILVSDLVAKKFADDPEASGMGVWFLANHYEYGATMHGEVWSGDRRRRVEGLMIRDHTWGPRDFHIEEIFWSPVVLDDAEGFIASSCALYQGKWRGYAIAVDGHGEPTLYDDYWVRTSAGSSRAAIESADGLLVSESGVDLVCWTDSLHIPAGRKNTFKDGQRGLVNVISHVTWNGRTGIGTLQHVPRGAIVSSAE